MAPTKTSTPVVRSIRRLHKTLRFGALRSIATWIMLASMIVCMGNPALAENLYDPGPQNTSVGQPPPDETQHQQQTSTAGSAQFSLPAGTKLPLGLVRLLSTNQPSPARLYICR